MNDDVNDDVNDDTPPASAAPSRTFFRVRVGLLLALLFGVLLYAARDVRQRRARNDWQRTLEVAVVVVRRGPTTHGAVEALRARLPALSDRLYAESRRHGLGATRPFHFVLVGPVDLAEPPPVRGEGLVEALRYLRAKAAYTSAIDRAVGLDADAYDTRIYVLATPPRNAKRAFVEGESEQGGRVGLVSVELVEAMSDLALFVVAHELFHTIGATDKYDERGETLVPAGLVVPRQVPLFPQSYVDVMARLRPVSATAGELPETIEELGVGPATAAEIGWQKR